MSQPSAAPMDKAPEAFRTISEVAAELDLPQHVLRFWESRFVQIRPVKRAGGRRYYRPQEIDLLRGIKRLLYGDGFTIKGVQKLFREHGARYITDIGRAAARAQPAFAFDAPPAPGTIPSALSEEKREKLELLLAELVGMKRQLRTAVGELGV